MRKAKVLFRDEEAGVIIEHDDGSFTFRYHDTWLANSDKPAISLTFPKTGQIFHSTSLFPFFFHKLPEGSNKQVVCMLNRIDPGDHFGLLLTTAKADSIGAVRVVKMDENEPS